MDNSTMNLISMGMGLLIALLAIPMILGKLRPNRIYGFRTRKTLSSPEIWYPANRAAGFAMLVAGLVMILITAGIMLFWKEAPETAFGWVHLALWAMAIGGMTVFQFRFTQQDLPGGTMKAALPAFVLSAMLALPAAASVDTLTAVIEEGDFAADTELFEMTFGGCSLACGIGWIFDATSELDPQSGFTYDAGNLGDIDRTTAWVEGVQGYGEGESLMAVFCYGPDDGEVPFRGLTIINGYAKTESCWESNSRVHLLEMKLNGIALFLIELHDSQQPQSVNWSEEIPVKNGDLLEFEIVSVYPGLSYDDTALTELIFWGAH